jgi:hypothetical protein
MTESSKKKSSSKKSSSGQDKGKSDDPSKPKLPLFATTIKKLVQNKILPVGGEVHVFGHKGYITAEGKINAGGKVHETPSAFAMAASLLNHPEKTHTSNYNGWDYVRYSGKRLGHYRTILRDRLREAGLWPPPQSASSSKAKPPKSKKRKSESSDSESSDNDDDGDNDDEDSSE